MQTLLQTSPTGQPAELLAKAQARLGKCKLKKKNKQTGVRARARIHVHACVQESASNRN